jgi:transcriptional regulator with XRE-family HTH domain
MQEKLSIKQRILQFVDSLGVSKRSFYEKTGISRGTLEGIAGITEDTLVKFITNYTNINPTWLLTGDGDMLLSDTRPERENWIVSDVNFFTDRYSQQDLLRVGARIDEICHVHDITHEQLAKKIGFDYNELAQIISGNQPAPEKLLQKIAKLFHHLSHTWLYCGKGSMHTWHNDAVPNIFDKAISEEQELISQYFCKPVNNENAEFLSTTEIVRFLKEKINCRINAISIGKALAMLGYKRIPVGDRRGYFLAKKETSDAAK